jgi:fused signal recognition particle receptor
LALRSMSSMMSKLRQGLSRTREAIGGTLRSLVSGRALDEALIRDIERALLLSDVGTAATKRLIDGLRADAKAGELKRGEDASTI